MLHSHQSRHTQQSQQQSQSSHTQSTQSPTQILASQVNHSPVLAQTDPSQSYFIFDELTTALQERETNEHQQSASHAAHHQQLQFHKQQQHHHHHHQQQHSHNNTQMQHLQQHHQQQQQQHSGVTTQHNFHQTAPQPPQQYSTSSADDSCSPTSLSAIMVTHSSAAQQQQQQQSTQSQLSQLQTSASTMSLSLSPPLRCSFGGDSSYHFKTLVPAVAAGAIIGKGGETIAALQKDTGARVKMSKAHDFYPGTSERVCLVTGSSDAILIVLDFIMDKIREKPDLTTKLTDIEAKQAQERDKQVKILVPNSTAGMIIGKAGAYIKQIKEDSGSYVQISQKPKDITLQERCITIIGDKENNKVACKMILAKIIEDPQSGTCLNVSYADINGPVANYNPTGSPYASNQNAISSSTASLNSALSTAVSGTSLLVNGTGINLSLNLGAPNPNTNPTVTTQLLDHIKIAMRGAGYSDPVTTEVCAALSVLAKYGVLGVGVGLAHTNGAHPNPLAYLGVSQQELAAQQSSVFGAIGQVNLDHTYLGTTSPTPRTLLDAPFDQFRNAGSQAATPVSINNNSFGLATGGASAQALGAAVSMGALSKSPTPGDIGAKESKNVEIPEVIVGAILGPSGRSLVEIQHISGATIQISKKGIFAPGTRNRIVTITGPSNAITMAHYLIETKINEEETKRARQNSTLSGIIQ